MWFLPMEQFCVRNSESISSSMRIAQCPFLVLCYQVKLVISVKDAISLDHGTLTNKVP